MHIYLLHNFLIDSANRYPDKEAVIFKDKSLTYSDLEKRSNQLALALLRLGVKIGDRVGIMLNKSIESIVCLFAILKTGAAYVPIDPRAPGNRARYIIRNCEIECLITSIQNITKIISDPEMDLPLNKALVSGGITEELKKQCRDLELMPWEELSEESGDDYQYPEITDTYPAYILHTSGSTGSPKGVVISHLNSLTFVSMAGEFFNITNKDRLSSHAPLHFDLSVFDIFVAVKCGATIVLVPEFLSAFPMQLAEYIDERRITIWNSVPSVLTMLADRGRLEKYRFNSLRLVHFAGDILPVKYLRILKKQIPGATFYNIYGQTEANSSMFYQIKDIKDDDTWKIPIGKPFPNFEVFALNDKKEVITGPGQDGELYVKSSTLASGYWHDEKKTQEQFVTDPRDSFFKSKAYKTGDMVRIGDDGNYYFVGRKDNMVKSRGYRIELNEIEITLNSHPLIRQAAVISIPDELIGNRIIACVSVIEGEKLEKNDLLSYCATLLPKYMIPEVVEHYDSLPTTSSGKINREVLKDKALSK